MEFVHDPLICFFFPLYRILLGNTGYQSYTGFRCSIPQHIISTLYGAFTTPGQGGFGRLDGGSVGSERNRQEKKKKLMDSRVVIAEGGGGERWKGL